MLHLIMTLIIHGAYTERVKCPETCSCVQTLVSEAVDAATTGTFDAINITDPNPEQSGVPNDFGMSDAEYKIELLGENKTFAGNYTQAKKCGKNKENVRDIFIRDFSTKSIKTQNAINSKEVRTKRTLKVDAKGAGGASNESLVASAPKGRPSESDRNKGMFTYQITCAGVRDLKSVWFRYLPSPTTQLNIRGTHFQSFKAFQQILKESPSKLSQLTVLSVSDSVINQTPDKKYSFKTESTNKEEKEDEGNVENKHSEFLPFASLQNPQPRSKSETGFPPRGKCKNLQVLNLVNDTITHLPEDTFRPFLNLQVLNISNNLIEFLDNDTFISLPNLLRLDVHNNRLQSLNEIMFKNLTKLLFLDVSQNLISNIAPSTFQYLISLNVLNLASNPLSEKQEAMILLGTGKRLQIVDVSSTGLKQIPGTLERSVRVLDLRGNLLLSVRCGDLDSYSLLSYLNLRGNKISYVEDDALGRLEFLNNLQISENNLFQIPKSLPNNLEILNLSYNNIQNITNLDFLNLSLLKELSLSYNQVSNIEENAFNNLVRLKVLDLSRNPILVLPSIYGRIKLSVLNLSYFTHIPGTFAIRYKQFPVKSPQSVKHLNLESSPVLTKIFLQDTDTLAYFTDLEELNIRFTNLTAIRKDIFDLLPKLRILKVEGNPWHCGREILILSEWLKSHENEETTEDEDEVNTAHCLTPIRLYKTTLITLREEDFEEERRKTDDRLLDSTENKTGLNSKSESPVKPENESTDLKFKNITGEVKRVNIKKYGKSGAKLNKVGGGGGGGKAAGDRGDESSQKNSTVAYLLPNKRISAKSSSGKANSGSDSTDSELEMKNSVDLKSGQVSSRTMKKAEAVTAQDTLSLKKEYNSHLSFLVLSSLGLVVMATLTFTSVYFTRTRRDQSYQRQNQDIEVCSISSLGNELW